MAWTKSFREAYLDKSQSSSESFEKDVVQRGLHRSGLPLAWMIRALMPGFFELELRTARYLGNARSSEEFRAELASYHSEYRRRGGFLRNALGIRLSGERLTDLLGEVSPSQRESDRRFSP